jgi:hypothetical protein
MIYGNNGFSQGFHKPFQIFYKKPPVSQGSGFCFGPGFSVAAMIHSNDSHMGGQPLNKGGIETGTKTGGMGQVGQGSGPASMDEMKFPSRIFKDLVRHHGICKSLTGV